MNVSINNDDEMINHSVLNLLLLKESFIKRPFFVGNLIVLNLCGSSFGRQLLQKKIHLSVYEGLIPGIMNY